MVLVPSMRWRPGRGSEEEAEEELLAAHAPLPPPAYAPAPPPRCRFCPPSRQTMKVLALVALAAVALGPHVGLRLRGASYGGLVGRTWTVKSPHEAWLAVGRLAASNLVGLEEEGWLTGVLHDTVDREHGGSCTSRLGGVEDGKGGGSSSRGGDLAVCPCLAIPRAGLPAPGSPDPPVPFFYLKLHKVSPSCTEAGRHTSTLVCRRMASNPPCVFCGAGGVDDGDLGPRAALR
jgi:hypothetical protein